MNTDRVVIGRRKLMTKEKHEKNSEKEPSELH